MSLRDLMQIIRDPAKPLRLRQQAQAKYEIELEKGILKFEKFFADIKSKLRQSQTS